MPPRGHTAAATARAHSSQDTRTGSQARPRPRAVAQRLPRSKLKWDRKFRFVMIGVVGLVGWIGLRAALALVAARAQAAQETSLVRSLESQHHALVAQEQALHERSTIIRDARKLGMVQAGERPYAVVAPGN